MDIFKCNRWQQPRLHILFLLPMETAENSPARLPQSVHWKASKTMDIFECNRWQQPRLHILFPLPMETVENSPCTVAAICALGSKQKLWISSSATNGSNRASTFSSRMPWRLLRIPLHGCRNLCTGKPAKNYGYLQVQQMAATAPSHSLPVAHGDC